MTRTQPIETDHGTPAHHRAGDTDRAGEPARARAHRPPPARPDAPAASALPPAAVGGPTAAADGARRRSRTYTWTDPDEVVQSARGRSGRDVLEAMASGELPPPPIAATLDVEAFEVGDGWAAVTARAQEFHYNPIGVVHGGVVATLLDTAAACAVHATLAAGEAYTSLDLTTKFVRPMTLDSGLVRCEGRVLHRGSRTAVAEATLVDEAGRLLAHATSTLILLPGPAPS